MIFKKPGGAEMRKILVPIDGSDYSNLAIDKAKEIAEKFNSEIVLIHVNDIQTEQFFINPGAGDSAPFFTDISKNPKMIPIRLPKEYVDEVEKAAEGILERGKARCSGSNVKVSTLSLQGKPADIIAEFAENNDIDLVVMGSQGMSGLKRFFVGSTTYKVIMSIKKPILIIR